MDAVVLTYRGREVTEADVVFIRGLIARHGDASRRQLSQLLCRAWNWVQPNGALRDMVCRGLMLALHRSGHIQLPPRRRTPNNPLAQRRQPQQVSIDSAPVECALRDVQPLRFRQVRRTSEEALVDGLIETHHYLGYTQPVGEHLKYLIYCGDRPLACMAWSSAARHLGARDRFIGWSPSARKQNIRFIAYNPRFLILPWVHVPHLASHILGWMARHLSEDWQRLYGHPVHYLETFVDPGLYKGTCYLAANWRVLGRTTGRGKDAPSKRPTRSVKEVLGYPLTRHFRRFLCETP
jgi:hypothetical protein